jgi:hypothetical protein
LIYRLLGDKNPLHVDPQFAQMGGFDRPILHGLSSFGVVCKAVVDNALDGDVTRVARYQVRFAGVVFPGETIVTSVWRKRAAAGGGQDEGARHPAHQRGGRAALVTRRMKLSTQLAYAGDYQAAVGSDRVRAGRPRRMVWIAEAYGFDAVSLIPWRPGPRASRSRRASCRSTAAPPR